MYPSPDARLPSPAPRRRWHPALAVPAVVLATLVVPPLGAALAFMARWKTAGRAVTVVLASVWFVVLMAAMARPQPARVDHKPPSGAQLVVTATASTPTAPAPVAASASAPMPAPVSPPARASTTPAPAVLPGAPGAAQSPHSEPVSARERQPVTDNRNARTPDRSPALVGPASGAGVSRNSGSGNDSGAFYRNCAAVRQAGVAPIRRGEPGFGPHLDRDGDGVACE